MTLSDMFLFGTRNFLPHSGHRNEKPSPEIAAWFLEAIYSAGLWHVFHGPKDFSTGRSGSYCELLFVTNRRRSPAWRDPYMSQRCSGLCTLAASQSALWNWNWIMKLTKYLNDTAITDTQLLNYRQRVNKRLACMQTVSNRENKSNTNSERSSVRIFCKIFRPNEL